MATVTEVLTAGTDSVNLIDGVKAGTWGVEGMTQDEINEMVQRNVDHLEIILEYKPVDSDDDTPNVKEAADSKKTTHVAAIATGKKYITDNS
ncbi:MAG: hypothetical protein CM15mV82_050 [uncultured marine virus]|nr:MAG: hypothetical protein CM15mV82_050 [uncultured marine virus]